MNVTAVVRLKANLARLHLQSANRFARQCEEIAVAESALDWPQPRWDESRSLASAAVVLSVAALEATANEFFLEAVDGNTLAMQRIGERSRRILATMWDVIDEHSILHKYEIALAICERPEFQRGEGPYQHAAALIKLRNALVHFKPEWDSELDRHAKLQRRLAGKFENCGLAAMAKSRMIWFPHECLGAGCARWSVNVTQEFIADFCRRLEIQPRC